jgi:glycosyltransferase involved in cell wall biosynthesis
VKFLLLNQTFHPDVMATGQYLTEVALELVGRGHQVTVVTSRRAYDRPTTLFPREETWRGIRICRVGGTGFGKGAKWRRAADFATFSLLCSLRLAVMPRHDVVVALTSPPLISFLGAWLAKVRRSRFFYWVMDFNPDEAIAAGWLRAGSLPARVLDWMSRFSLKRATRIIALDRFMRDRIVAKGIAPAKVAVLPPWSHDSDVRFDGEGRKRFRKAHGLEGKFVVMYSGNHSPCHPLDTLIEAARRLAADRSIVFCFVGGGSEFRKIQQMAGAQASTGTDKGPGTWDPGSGSERRTDSGTAGQQVRHQKPEVRSQRSEVVEGRLPNILCLPYQPLAELAGSLSAADLQVVVMGEVFVGLVHPCKIYNILGVGAPVLYLGPQTSHLSEILASLNGDHHCASARHGEVDRVVDQIQRIRRERKEIERKAPERARSVFSKEAILPKLVAELESG